MVRAVDSGSCPNERQSAMNIIEELEKEQIAELEAKRAIPEFAPGDTLRVSVKVKDGERERVQIYEGVVIARDGGGLHELSEVLPAVEHLRQDNPEQAKGRRKSGSRILPLLDSLTAAGELAFGGQEPCCEDGFGG